MEVLFISTDQLSAALGGNQRAFSNLVEPYRRELQLHCYRLLGSLQDAEDLVQETLLRAWRRLDSFEGRASLRTWLYRIATNACFDALDKRRRRLMPASLYPPANPANPLEAFDDELTWLEPYPDHLLPEGFASPEARYIAHETISLAFLTALQVLPPRQRAVLILRDVLDWDITEIAGHLEMTVSAVNSVLHRARATLNKNYSAEPRTPQDASTQSLLTQYVHAWETANIQELVTLLKDDATLSMPPSPFWFRGRDAIGAILANVAFKDSVYQLRGTRANGYPAFAFYESKGGDYHAAGIQVLTLSPSGQISDVITFMTPALVSRFGFPDQPDQAARR